MIRKSLDVKSWDAAQRIVRDWEAGDYREVVKIADAGEKWIKEARARKLKGESVRKLKQLLKALLAFCELKKLSLLTDIKVESMREFRQGWPYAPRTQEKKLELLKSFFRFCVRSGWIPESPAAPLDPPLVDEGPTLPFTDADLKNIFAVLENPEEIRFCMTENRTKLKAIVMVMLYTGLRISDAVCLQREKLNGKRLLLRALKNQAPVYTILPKGHWTHLLP